MQTRSNFTILKCNCHTKTILVLPLVDQAKQRWFHCFGLYKNSTTHLLILYEVSANFKFESQQLLIHKMRYG